MRYETEVGEVVTFLMREEVEGYELVWASQWNPARDETLIRVDYETGEYGKEGWVRKHASFLPPEDWKPEWLKNPSPEFEGVYLKPARIALLAGIKGQL